jgi:hypothetical protein
MRAEDVPLGGGNIGAILVSGSLMFLFYEVGWSIMGTIFLVLFLIAGWKSLFPIIAAFIGFGRFMCAYAYESSVFYVLIFWIILLLLVEFTARFGRFDEENKKTSKDEKK